ncbi:MAG TPA: M14 family metallopeptidase [Candidatus Saccharicenans sp.]|nr:M14 family metallopeptidase [Candidatus Saccharicenans sp.]HQM75036.1 M14 family metallopeptidase [Candidatus Saccharicenans sp.]
MNGAYHSYAELESELKKLVLNYPSIARLSILGQSLEKRNIYALKISDHPGQREDEPRLALLGCHHAREWISVEVPLQIAAYLLKNYARDERIKTIVDSSEIWLVPLINPDGLDYSIINYRLWRKNRRLNLDGSFGVDLNRNYSFAWGIDDSGSSPHPASETYRGRQPFSEPETRAIRDLFQQVNFSAAISYHSFSASILYPWSYADLPADQEPLFQQLAAGMARLMSEVNGRIYYTGRAASSLYLTNGDFIDWVYAFFNIPAFTIELPPVDLQEGGFFNSEQDIQSLTAENLPAVIYLLEWAISTDSNQDKSLKLERKNQLEKAPGNGLKNKRNRL